MKIGLRSDAKYKNPDRKDVRKYHRVVDTGTVCRAWCNARMDINRSTLRDDDIAGSQLCGRCFAGRSRSDG